MKRQERNTDKPRSSRRLGRIVRGSLVAAGVLIVAAIANMPTQTTPTPPAEPVAVNVTVQPVQPVPEMADTFGLTGIVQPRAVVAVAAEVPGRIEAYGTRKAELQRPGGVLAAGSAILEGQPVSQGDPLVLLNRELLQARYDRAAAQYENDEQELLRIQGLLERGSAQPNEVRRARTSRELSKADLDEAARSLERATVVAPMDGILNDWRMEVGEYASPGQVVAEIVDIEKVKVLVDVPERDVGYLRVGQDAQVIPLSGESESVTGTITYINALADEATRTTRVEVTVDNRIAETDPAGSRASSKEYHLRSGQIVKVELTRRALKDVVMIPLASVIPLEHGKEVYVVNDGKAERRPVELGFIRGRSIQITRGLEPGESLIVAGHRLVSPGQPVNVIDSPSTLPSAEPTTGSGGTLP